MNQVELLLRLSENAQERGDEIAQRYHAERAAHIKDLNRLLEMIDAARQNVQNELSRFGVGVAQVPKAEPENIAKEPAPGFLLKGGPVAAGTRVESRDDKPQHPRAIPSR